MDFLTVAIVVMVGVLLLWLLLSGKLNIGKGLRSIDNFFLKFWLAVAFLALLWLLTR